MEAKKSGEPGWKWRRWIIFPVVAFACWQLHLLRSDADTRVNEMLTEGWLWVTIVLVLGYSGLATVQDAIAIWRTRSALPYTNAARSDGSPEVR
ncbi:hypothetical protein [Rhizobium halophytocola]|uniref:Uncharacterized protein n=1 Tax=Rhizobium halophytocola TaxID=735519 RepID=A0ABS4E2C8_9HYPH|nr:hypothetical protein [Rhizobium halophytocola]MBP1852102.1 hypothetical protein [Rhizobium halophytocola]